MELSKAVNETRSRMDLAQSELDIYLSRHNTAVTQLNTAKQTLETASTTLRERRVAIKDLGVKIPQKEQELKKVKPALTLLSYPYNMMKSIHNIINISAQWLTSFVWAPLKLTLPSPQDEAELGQLMKMDNETREVVREMRQKVDEAKSSLSSNRSQGKVLDALMQQKKTGRIPGIFGRLVNKWISYKNSNITLHLQEWYASTVAVLYNILLYWQGDLGAIDEKYDVAISSSCGALDHIVVDTIDTAQKCVTFLKEQNIGRATFIGLDKVKIIWPL